MSGLPLLSPGEIASFSQFAAQSMQSTGYVLRDATGNGAAADFQPTPATSAGIPTRVQPYMGRRQGREYGRVLRDENLSYWEIWFPLATDVTTIDRIRVNGTDYRVLALSTDQTFEAVRRCLCVRVQ